MKRAPARHRREVRQRARVSGWSLPAWFATMLAMPNAARADDADPWFGRDKALHFTVAAGIAGAGYGVTTAFTQDRWKAFAVGGGAALAAGVLKEGIDATGRGDPSWKDLGWDVVGAVAGLAVAWGIDVFVHGGNVPPLSSRFTIDARAYAGNFALRF